MKRTLFEISDDLLALADLLEETGGEITDEAAENAIDDFFLELGAERDKKLDSYCALIREFEARQDVREQEAKRLLALAQTDGKNAKKLKERLLFFFQTQDLKKVETDRFKISRQANGGKMPVVLNPYLEEHPEELPEGLRRVRFSPDLDAIREYIEQNPEDADVVGYLGTRGEHLRIK